MEEKPIYIAKLAGAGRRRDSDIARIKEKLEHELGGKVIVIDSGIECITQLEPRDASGLVELAYNYVRKIMREVE